MSSTNDPSRLRTLLREPGMAGFLAGRFLAATGIWSERIAIGWLVWERTGSTAMLGLAAFLKLGPAIVLAPVGGVLADRIGAVGVLRATYALNAALAGTLALATTALPLAALLVATAGLGCAQAVAAAPIKSVVPQIVRREHVSTALPLSSATFNLAAFVGPAVAGVAIATVGVWAAFAVSAVGAAAFVAVLGRWRTTDRRAAATGAGWMAEIAEAAEFVGRDAGVRTLFALHLAASLCLRPFVDLLPAHVARLGGGAAMLGFATSAFGAGAVLGAGWMAAAASDGALARRLLVGTAVAILALLLVAWEGGTAPFLLALGAFGAAMMVRATATLTTIQLVVPPEMRGRVSGLYSTVIRGGAALGAVLIGLAAAWLGLGVATAGAALLCAAALAACWRRVARPNPLTGE